MGSEDIYEFDLNSLFPSVNLSEIDKLMGNKLKYQKNYHITYPFYLFLIVLKIKLI